MKPIDWFEKLIRDLHVLDINTSAEMDKRILHDTLKVQQELTQTKLAETQPDIWRKIMKSTITKLAAAAIIVVIGLGILTFINTGSKSGALWAQVARNVEASPGGVTGRIWTAVETGYPILVEVEAIDDKGIRHTSTLDQFEWNVDLSAGDVEPEIRADYESLSLEGEMKILSEQGKKELLKVEEILRDGAIAWKVHVYKYELSDGQIKEIREGGDGMPVYSQDQFKEFKPKLDEFRQLKKAGSGEDLGTYEETVEGRVFSFKREKYILSDGTEITWSVGMPKEG